MSPSTEMGPRALVLALLPTAVAALRYNDKGTELGPIVGGTAGVLIFLYFMSHRTAALPPTIWVTVTPLLAATAVGSSARTRARGPISVDRCSPSMSIPLWLEKWLTLADANPRRPPDADTYADGPVQRRKTQGS